MASVVIVDDDYSMHILADTLEYRGHSVQRMRTVDEALDQIDDLLKADLLILDIMMQPPAAQEQGGEIGGRAAGMRVHRAVREREVAHPILVFSATTDAEVVSALRDDPHTALLSKWGVRTLEEVVQCVGAQLGIAISEPQPIAFIIHGHDAAAKLELKNYLQNTLGFPEPIILHEQPSLGRTIIEKLEDMAGRSDFAFALLTPDDLVSEANQTNDEKRRARQNVIFELGYFLGVLGRESGRVLLLHKGPLDLPSDLSGVIYIDISDGVDAASEQIRRELANVRI